MNIERIESNEMNHVFLCHKNCIDCGSEFKFRVKLDVGVYQSGLDEMVDQVCVETLSQKYCDGCEYPDKFLWMMK